MPERRRAMTFNNSSRANFFFMPNKSQNYEVIAMDHFDPAQVAILNFLRIEAGDATGKFRSIQIADPDDFAGGEFAFAPRDARRQQTPATLTQGFFGPGIDEEGALRMMEERNPPFAALQPGGLRHEQR